MLGELECRQGRALVARTGLIDPYVHRNSTIMRKIDGGEGSAVVNSRQPTCVAVSEDVESPAGLRQRLDQLHTMLAYRPASGDILVADRRRALVRGLDPLLSLKGFYRAF